jgi:hypothetical protein
LSEGNSRHRNLSADLRIGSRIRLPQGVLQDAIVGPEGWSAWKRTAIEDVPCAISGVVLARPWEAYRDLKIAPVGLRVHPL